MGLSPRVDKGPQVSPITQTQDIAMEKEALKKTVFSYFYPLSPNKKGYGGRTTDDIDGPKNVSGYSYGCPA